MAGEETGICTGERFESGTLLLFPDKKTRRFTLIGIME
jgi:hypothetical protein